MSEVKYSISKKEIYRYYVEYLLKKAIYKELPCAALIIFLGISLIKSGDLLVLRLLGIGAVSCVFLCIAINVWKSICRINEVTGNETASVILEITNNGIVIEVNKISTFCKWDDVYMLNKTKNSILIKCRKNRYIVPRSALSNCDESVILSNLLAPSRYARRSGKVISHRPRTIFFLIIAIVAVIYIVHEFWFSYLLNSSIIEFQP